MKIRAAFVALSASLALLLSPLGAPAASADPATDGWRHGFCKEDEGLTVVVDFGDEADRDPEVRCQIGGDFDRGDSTRVTALEAVGYEVTSGSSGLVTHIDGVGNPEGYPWWMYSSTEGPVAWDGTGWELPSGNVTNYFYGVCYSTDGCTPRISPQYAPEATATITGTTSTDYGKAATVKVTVKHSDDSAPSGPVRLTGVGAARTATIKAGTASFALPKTVKVGTYKLTASYNGPGGATSSSAYTLKVRKGSTKHPTIKFATKPTVSRRGQVTITVGRAGGLVAPSGKTVLAMTKGKTKITINPTLRGGGVRSVALPKLAKGTWRVRVKFNGNGTYKASRSKAYHVTVR